MRSMLYAGSWYPTTRKEIERYFPMHHTPRPAIACVVPHAGWMYSGKTAARVFSEIKPVRRYVIIGPNHHGLGARVGIYPSGSWDTPMGPLKIDDHFAAIVSKHSRVATLDQLPHLEEHSIEVILPLIRRISPDALIVPIAMSDDRPSVCRDIGEAVAAAMRMCDGASDTLIVASTDMSHYIPASRATVLDNHALERIKVLDAEGLLSAVEAHGLTMCGAGPVAAALFAARACGATGGELVEYTSSATVTGDQDSVVAYAGMVIR